MAHKSSICSMSLGRCFAGHSLEHKLDMASKYGFQGIEFFYEDIADFAKTFPGVSTQEKEVAACHTIAKLCQDRSLEIICIQPFMHFGGIVDREEHRRRLRELEHWFDMCHAMGTDLIMCPSTFLSAEQVSSDLDQIVADYTEAADMALQQTPVIRLAVEALCWGTHMDKWEPTWDLVKRVDRPNFGLCLDTFNILGRTYADPASPTGRNPDAEQSTADSISNMLHDIDASKLFLLQVADGQRLRAPLDKNHPYYNAEQPPRMSWGRNARLFYGEPEQGGYLPVKNVLTTIVQGLGFEGWLSFEVFHKRLTETDESVPEEMARRGSESFAKMIRDIGLRTEATQTARTQAML